MGHSVRGTRKRVATAAKRGVLNGLAKVGLKVTRTIPWGGADPGIGTVIDVGCAWGTKQLLEEFPHTPFVLIDPLREYRSRMEEIVAQRGGHIFTCGLGSKTGTMTMSVGDSDNLLASGFATRTTLVPFHVTETRSVPVKRLDDLLSGLKLDEPFLLKIDTEGWELEVLRGAAETLKRTSILITETSIAPRFVDGYRCLDLISEVSELGFDLETILTADPDNNRIVRFADLRFRNRNL